MKKEDVSSLNKSMIKMQKWLFEQCDTNKTTIQKLYTNDLKLQKNRYHYHEAMDKKLLQRPAHLKSAKLVTKNYDKALKYAIDNVEVHNINGYKGVLYIYFKVEERKYRRMNY